MARWLPWLLIVFFPVTAHGWTEADVRRGSAHVEVSPEGSAVVSLEVELVVSRGWLEEFEFNGLGDNIALDPNHPPSLTSIGEPSQKFSPEVLPVTGGFRLRLSGRGNSPRRGRYRVHARYTTKLPSNAIRSVSQSDVEVHWTFPSWRTSLDDVSVSISVPSPHVQEAAAMTHGDATHARSRIVRGQHRGTIIFSRKHLPRTVPWAVGAQFPAAALAPGVVPSPQPAHQGAAGRKTANDEDATVTTLAVALLVALFLSANGFLYRRATQRRGGTPSPLVPLQPVLRSAISLLLAGAAGLLWKHSPATALVCTGLTAVMHFERTPQTSTSGTHDWRPATAHDLRCGRRMHMRTRLGWHGFADLTTPTGAGLVAVLVGLLVSLRPTEVDLDSLIAFLALALTPLASATRFHLPSTGATRLAQLPKLTLGQPRDGRSYALEVCGDPIEDARLICRGPGSAVTTHSLAEVSGPGGRSSVRQITALPQHGTSGAVGSGQPA